MERYFQLKSKSGHITATDQQPQQKQKNSQPILSFQNTNNQNYRDANSNLEEIQLDTDEDSMKVYMSNLRHENESLKQRLSESDLFLKESQNKLEKLNQKHEKLKVEYSALQSKHTREKNICIQLETTNAILMENIGYLKNLLEEEQDSNRLLNEKLIKVGKQALSLSDEVELKYQIEIENLSRKVNQINDQKESAQQQRDEILRELEDLTQVLFQEANSMVSGEARQKAEILKSNQALQSQLEEAKTLLMTESKAKENLRLKLLSLALRSQQSSSSLSPNHSSTSSSLANSDSAVPNNPNGLSLNLQNGSLNGSSNSTATGGGISPSPSGSGIGGAKLSTQTRESFFMKRRPSYYNKISASASSPLPSPTPQRERQLSGTVLSDLRPNENLGDQNNHEIKNTQETHHDNQEKDQTNHRNEGKETDRADLSLVAEKLSHLQLSLINPNTNNSGNTSSEKLLCRSDETNNPVLASPRPSTGTIGRKALSKSGTSNLYSVRTSSGGQLTNGIGPTGRRSSIVTPPPEDCLIPLDGEKNSGLNSRENSSNAVGLVELNHNYTSASNNSQSNGENNRSLRNSTENLLGGIENSYYNNYYYDIDQLNSDEFDPKLVSLFLQVFSKPKSPTNQLLLSSSSSVQTHDQPLTVSATSPRSQNNYEHEYLGKIIKNEVLPCLSLSSSMPFTAQQLATLIQQTGLLSFKFRPLFFSFDYDVGSSLSSPSSSSPLLAPTLLTSSPSNPNSSPTSNNKRVVIPSCDFCHRQFHINFVTSFSVNSSCTPPSSPTAFITPTTSTSSLISVNTSTLSVPLPSDLLLGGQSLNHQNNEVSYVLCKFCKDRIVAVEDYYHFVAELRSIEDLDNEENLPEMFCDWLRVRLNMMVARLLVADAL